MRRRIGTALAVLNAVSAVSCVLLLVLLLGACDTTTANPPRLKSLKIFATIGGSSEMEPRFDPAVKEYTLKVQSDIASIGVKAVADTIVGTAITANGRHVGWGPCISHLFRQATTRSCWV